MKTFPIGPGLTCHLETLVNTRLLVQANSGAGKSWLLRRILEQTNGTIQHLVLDPEGEFASLRTAYDYVLAAKTGGDTLADPRAATLLAHRLLELGASAILDIYELNPRDRVRFVRLFLDALVDAPKTLWHPVLVVVDEAHVYAPEKGDAESADAVKALCTRGRKRGFCAVLATQRLSKLHKDAAAEANNKLIGRSALDIDMKRASEELGFASKEQTLSLRDLRAGEFYAFGPALTHSVTKVMVGPVKTEHPKAGSKLACVVPPPPDKVKALLPKLKDLPAEAEQKAKTEAELRREVAKLKRQLARAERIAPSGAVTMKAIKKSVLTEADRELLAKFTRRFRELGDVLLGDPTASLGEYLHSVKREIQSAWSHCEGLHLAARRDFAKALDSKGLRKVLAKLESVANSAITPAKNDHRQPRPSLSTAAQTRAESQLLSRDLPIGERATLTAALQYEGLARSRLKARGLVEFCGRGTVRASDALFDS